MNAHQFHEPAENAWEIFVTALAALVGTPVYVTITEAGGAGLELVGVRSVLSSVASEAAGTAYERLILALSEETTVALERPLCRDVEVSEDSVCVRVATIDLCVFALET